MRCPNCGNEGDTLFCTNCGTKLETDAVQKTMPKPELEASPAAVNIQPEAQQTNTALEQGSGTPPSLPLEGAPPPAPPVEEPVRYIPSTRPHMPKKSKTAGEPRTKVNPAYILLAVIAFIVIASVVVATVFWFTGQAGTASGSTKIGLSNPLPVSAYAKTVEDLFVRQIDSKNFPEMTIYVDAQDDDQKPVAGLLGGDFFVEEEDSEGNSYLAQILEVSQVQKQQQASVNLVIDRSGSMNGSSMDQALNAAGLFLEQVDFATGDSVAITSFDDYIYEDQPFTSDGDALARSLQYIIPNGQTALYDALYSALLSTLRQDGAKCVIAFTDGEENASHYSFEDVVELSQNTGIPVFLVGVGTSPDAAMLQNLAQECMGQYFSADSSALQDSLMQIYTQVYTVQQEWYAIRYTSSFDTKTDSERSVNVAVQSEEQKVFARATQAYTPVVVIDTDFLGNAGTLDPAVIYTSFAQYLLGGINLSQGSSANLQRLCASALNTPAAQAHIRDLSAAEISSLDISYAGLSFEKFISFSDFSSVLYALYGSAAPAADKLNFLTAFTLASNPTVYTFNGNGYFVAYTSVLDGYVLGRTDIASSCRTLNYISSAQRVSGSINVYLVQYIVCRGEYQGGGFMPTPGGTTYVLLDKYGETVISESDYNLLLSLTDFAALQQAIAECAARYNVTGAEYTITMQDTASLDDSTISSIVGDTRSSNLNFTPDDALSAAGAAYRSYYESYLIAINQLNGSLITGCTENQRQRQDARIIKFNKDYTFQNTALYIDKDSYEFVYENGRPTVRFIIRCENDMWKRDIAGAATEKNVALQKAELYYDTDTGLWVVASSIIDNKMILSSNLLSV